MNSVDARLNRLLIDFACTKHQRAAYTFISGLGDKQKSNCARPSFALMSQAHIRPVVVAMTRIDTPRSNGEQARQVK